MNSLFATQSIDRNLIHWEDHILDQSPVEKIGEMYFKREDTFAPLGMNGINGSKLRQCIWLVNRYVKGTANPLGLVSGASVKSPQLSMGTAVATHYGLPSVHVLGATKESTAWKHENVTIATWLGAKFDIQKVGYNPVLQRRVANMLAGDYAGWFHLEYGISLNHQLSDPRLIENFHAVGAEQVKNLPDDIETLILPAGSCNSVTSVLYGLAKHGGPKKLKKLVLLGIGPTRLNWIYERLHIIELASGIKINTLFDRHFVHDPKEQAEQFHTETPRWEMWHYNLHSTKFASYQDEMPFTYHGLNLHPTYEGKMMTYLSQNLPELMKETSCFWIVGSRGTKEAMAKALPQMGDFPRKVVLA
jgi:hypothetical protein